MEELLEVIESGRRRREGIGRFSGTGAATGRTGLGGLLCIISRLV